MATSVIGFLEYDHLFSFYIMRIGQALKTSDSVSNIASRKLETCGCIDWKGSFSWEMLFKVVKRHL